MKHPSPVQTVQIPPLFLKLPMHFFLGLTIQKHPSSALSALTYRHKPLNLLVGGSHDPATRNLY